ncbi:MAG: glycosyltransferase [Clostridia bacterium]
MKIMISNATLVCGGAERVIANLSNELVRQGHEVEILLYYDRPVWFSLDTRIKITVDEKNIGKVNFLKHILWRRKYIKKIHPDVMLSFLATFNMVNIIAMTGLRIPLIVADRSDPTHIPANKCIRKLRDFLYRFADTIVLQSKKNQRYFSNAVQRKSAVIYNPVDVGHYRGSAVHYPKQKKIVYVGRMIRKKNPMLLLEAFYMLAEEFPDYKLVFYGDGDLRGEIREKALEYGLEKRVEIPGAIKDIFENICDAELYVLTSDYEGMPNALMEAMCLGLPVISTKVSGATDVIEDGKNGLLVDSGDTEALANAMRKMLSDHMFRSSTAKAAAQLAEQLEIGKITEEWMKVIDYVK